MCGIAGFVDQAERASGSAPATIGRMIATVAHRGPDGEGIWLEDGGIAALGHRRLAIIDLSEAGKQPMASADGRWLITYNGEIYNFRVLRAELEALGTRFRGHSDTEAMVEGFSRWGVEETAKRLNGIFALAVWDRKEREMYLVRDRLGIKPLYWYFKDGLLLFGSELKALRAHPGWTPRINRDALASYFRLNYIPAPQTIYHDTYKLPPGGLLRLPWGGAPSQSLYWDLYAVAGDGAAHRRQIGDGDAVDEFETLLKDAVGGQMMSDVPLGALLSGGIDSSTVVALMQAQSSRPIKTFSIGFSAADFNEAPYAAAVARHLGTEHTEIYLEPSEALNVIPKLSEWYDEPFADSSQIPTFLVSRLARQHVTVALSGDGGDELFAGYPRYGRHPGIWNRARGIPLPLRRAFSRGVQSTNAGLLTGLMNALPRRMRTVTGGGTLLRLANALTKNDPRAFHRAMVSYWENPQDIVPGAHELANAFDRELPAGLCYRDIMQLLDTATFMIDDVLCKVDRASMAVALEVRVPLLDHRVVEFAWTMPERMKLRGDVSKWLLRQVLYRHVPRQLIDRPKAGFAIPVEQWLRGELRDWAENLLDEKRLREQGVLNVAAVRRIWHEHSIGAFNHSDRLWGILQLQSWLERWSP